MANSPADGYTFLIVSQATAVNPWLRKLPYDPAKAFVPVAIMLTTPNAIVANPSVPANSIKELIALAKAKPGQLQYASSGVGTFLHLGAELFKIMAGVDILHVPFKGAAPAMIDVVGGHTQLAFASATTAMPHIRSGKLKPGQPVRLESDPPFKYDVQKRVPDVSKSEKVLGFQCPTSLDKMLDEVVPWVKQQVELGNI